MDALFERRNLKKKVLVTGKSLQKNIESSILARLRQDFEGECSAEGYIQPNSVTIINYSLGRADFRGMISYDVEFQADVCLPHIGQRFRAPVTLRSKVGIHAETPPIKVLIPRDLHIGNEEFESIKVDEDIEFEVMGKSVQAEGQGYHCNWETPHRDSRGQWSSLCSPPRPHRKFRFRRLRQSRVKRSALLLQPLQSQRSRREGGLNGRMVK
jgi:DNA-directed RNA polymerase subunit E'/Rpb7